MSLVSKVNWMQTPLPKWL